MRVIVNHMHAAPKQKSNVLMVLRAVLTEFKVTAQFKYPILAYDNMVSAVQNTFDKFSRHKGIPSYVKSILT